MMVVRLMVPLMLLVLGLCVLVGCLYLPGDFKRVDGRPRPEERIGADGSDKELQIGRSTRERVVTLPGDPEPPGTPVGRTLIYPYRIHSGELFLLCFGVTGPYADRFLRVEFDERGVLRAYKVFKTRKEAEAARL